MQDETSTSEPIGLIERLKKEEENSETLTGNPRSRSVYDFLYHDVRRVASFLAQFEGHGVAGSIKTSAVYEDSKVSRKIGEGSAGFPGIAQGKTSIEKLDNRSAKEGTEKTYDPLWQNAIRFLEYIDEHDLLQREILQSSLGQIVLATGPIAVIDPRILRECYNEPAFKAQLRNNQEIKSIASGGASDKEKNKMLDLFFAVLTKMPHEMQLHMLPLNYSVWATLNTDSLVGLSSDIVLKNGAFVPGIWNMIGIMDAFPDWALQRDEDGKLFNTDEFITERMSAPVTKVMASLAPVIRQSIGRPDDYFGMTPLVVFREVGPISNGDAVSGRGI